MDAIKKLGKFHTMKILLFTKMDSYLNELFRQYKLVIMGTGLHVNRLVENSIVPSIINQIKIHMPNINENNESLLKKE